MELEQVRQGNNYVSSYPPILTVDDQQVSGRPPSCGDFKPACRAERKTFKGGTFIEGQYDSCDVDPTENVSGELSTARGPIWINTPRPTITIGLFRLLGLFRLFGLLFCLKNQRHGVRRPVKGHGTAKGLFGACSFAQKKVVHTKQHVFS